MCNISNSLRNFPPEYGSNTVHCVELHKWTIENNKTVIQLKNKIKFILKFIIHNIYFIQVHTILLYNSNNY